MLCILTFIPRFSAVSLCGLHGRRYLLLRVNGQTVCCRSRSYDRVSGIPILGLTARITRDGLPVRQDGWAAFLDLRFIYIL